MADPTPPNNANEDGGTGDDQTLNFNRITLSSAFKTQIMKGIDESTDSLPLPAWGQRGLDEDATAVEKAGEAKKATTTTTATATATVTTTTTTTTGGMDEVATPALQKDDPLLGADLSAEKTVTQADDDTPKKSRPGALRRLTTKIRKTISSSSGEKDHKSKS